MFDFLKKSDYSFHELNEARQLIEPLLVELVARKISASEARELKESIRVHEEHVNRNLSTEGGWQFYILLARFSRNKVLAAIEQLLLRLLIDVEHSMNISIMPTQSDENRKYNLAALEGQKRVAELIVKKDPEAAGREMLSFRKRMHRLLEEIEKRQTG